MKGVHQGKPKLQILKNQHTGKHNYRTQENSPIELTDHVKLPYHFEISIPQIARVTDRAVYGVKAIKSLQTSKEKESKHDNANTKPTIFGINFLKNHNLQLDKEEIINGSGRRKKNQPISQRRVAEKKNRFTEGSQKDDGPGQSSEKNTSNYGKIKFRLGTKTRNMQKTQQILLDSPNKRQGSDPKTQTNRKLLAFPRSQRLRIDGTEEDFEFPNSQSKTQKNLTPFEREELKHYEIYYVGQRRIYNNSDFTDSEGDPKVLIQDSVAYRYEIISQLGRGSFGKVFKAFDHKKKEYVALKLIKSQKKFQEQGKVEISILQTALLKDPKFRCNIVRMKGSFVFRGHTCITFQILHKNLYEFLKEHQFAGFSHDLIRRFSIQILQALAFFRRNNIIHCDLKPQNILLKEQNKSGIRVIDVGSGCFEDRQIYTYIQSRFYRAPEIIFGIKYTPAIDMWSFGCILVELFTGYPIFPGESENEQVMLFMEVLGNPPREMLEISERRKKFFDDDFKCKIEQEKGKERQIGSISLQEIVGSTDKSFMHLITRCLEWNPKKRITAVEALMHEWILKGLPDPIREQHIEQLKQQTYY